MQKFQNFDLAVIFIGMHHMSSYISISCCKTLGSYRMSCFLPVFSIQGVYCTPKVGVFSKTFKKHNFCCFIAQLIKKLQHWSIYEVIEDMLPFVLNTKQLLSNIWLLRNKQNNFGCLRKKKTEFEFFQKTPKLFCL